MDRPPVSVNGSKRTMPLFSLSTATGMIGVILIMVNKEMGLGSLWYIPVIAGVILIIVSMFRFRRRQQKTEDDDLVVLMLSEEVEKKG